MYKVLLERRVEKDLNELDTGFRKKVIGRFLVLKKNPRPKGARKFKNQKIYGVFELANGEYFMKSMTGKKR